MTELLRELQALEAELHHPGVRCTRERLERLLHPDFHEVGRSGRRYTRKSVIEHLESQVQPPEVVAAEYGVRELGDGCALLTYSSAHREKDGSLSLPALRCSIWLHTP